MSPENSPSSGMHAVSTLITCVAALCGFLVPAHVLAGDLNAEVNNMFNNLGAIGNYTAPGAFKAISHIFRTVI